MGTFIDLLKFGTIDEISLGCPEHTIVRRLGRYHDILAGKRRPMMITKYGAFEFLLRYEALPLNEYFLDSFSIHFDELSNRKYNRHYREVFWQAGWLPNHKTTLIQFRDYVLSHQMTFDYDQSLSYDEFDMFNIGSHITVYFKKRKKDAALYLLSIYRVSVQPISSDSKSTIIQKND